MQRNAPTTDAPTGGSHRLRLGGRAALWAMLFLVWAAPARALPVVAPPAGAGAGSPTLGPWLAAASAAPVVQGWLWSGALPDSLQAWDAFANDNHQRTLQGMLLDVRRALQKQLSFDPLDAQALRRVGIVPAAGVTLLRVAQFRTPLLLVEVDQQAQLEGALLAALAEEEGAGAWQRRRSKNQRPYVMGRRRFGAQSRDDLAFAALDARTLLLAPAGGEAALCALLDGLVPPAGGQAGAPGAKLLPLGATWTLGVLGQGGQPRTTKDLLQVRFAGNEVVFSGALAHPRAGAAVQPLQAGGPGLLPRQAGNDNGLLATLSGQSRTGPGGPLARLGQKDGAQQWQATQGLAQSSLAHALPPQLTPLLAMAGQAGRQLFRVLTQPLTPADRGGDLPPLLALLALEDGPTWLELQLDDGPATAAGPPLGLGLVARFDRGGSGPANVGPGKTNAGTLRRWHRRACAGGAARPSQRGPAGAGGGAQLACETPLALPAGRLVPLSVRDAGATTHLGVLLGDTPGAPAWLLLASSRPQLVQLGRRLPAPGQTKGGAAAPVEAPSALYLPAWQRTEPPMGTGTLRLGKLADAVTTWLRGGGLAAMAPAQLNSAEVLRALPQLLLAGPLGDSLRELSALGQLHLRLRDTGTTTYVAGRLVPEP